MVETKKGLVEDKKEVIVEGKKRIREGKEIRRAVSNNHDDGFTTTLAEVVMCDADIYWHEEEDNSGNISWDTTQQSCSSSGNSKGSNNTIKNTVENKIDYQLDENYCRSTNSKYMV